jgi:hypothetical protein
VTGPALKPVRRRDLVVVAVGLALATWLVVRATYGSLPDLRWWMPIPLGVLAVAEALGARTLRIRLEAERRARAEARRGHAEAARPLPARTEVRPVEPMMVARLAVLAQASAYVGAVFFGVWGGLLLHVGPAVGRLQSAAGDSVAATIGVVCSAGLAVGALLLESVCRIPPSGDDDRGPTARA